jgi:origin recognition complex subunit 3
VAVAFKLHSEMGRLINLFDWLQAWLSVVNDNETSAAEVDPVFQAKFTEAVSALQFLGFVKPSKKKTDHLAKLTWGE